MLLALASLYRQAATTSTFVPAPEVESPVDKGRDTGSRRKVVDPLEVYGVPVEKPAQEILEEVKADVRRAYQAPQVDRDALSRVAGQVGGLARQVARVDRKIQEIESAVEANHVVDEYRRVSRRAQSIRADIEAIERRAQERALAIQRDDEEALKLIQRIVDDEAKEAWRQIWIQSSRT